MKKAVCAVMTKNFLAHGRVLAESIRQHNPSLEIIIFLTDRLEECFKPENEVFKLVELDKLSDQKMISDMSFYYTPYEFCGAIRPLVHEYMMKQKFERWIYLDTDMMVFSSLDPLFAELDSVDVLLTLHMNSPAPDVKELRAEERKMLTVGIFNSGFVGIKNSENSRQFISWWKDRLRTESFKRIGKGMFLDQLCLTYAPFHFQGVKTCNHPGLNVAVWNLHERNLECLSSGEFKAGGQPLVAYHFSGWRIDKPENAAKFMPFYDNYADPVWKKLSALYKQNLTDREYFKAKSFPYTFGFFTDGRVILPEMRRYYFKLLEEKERRFDSPFDNAEFFYEIFCKRPVRIRKFVRRLIEAFKKEVKRF